VLDRGWLQFGPAGADSRHLARLLLLGATVSNRVSSSSTNTAVLHLRLLSMELPAPQRLRKEKLLKFPLSYVSIIGRNPGTLIGTSHCWSRGGPRIRQKSFSIFEITAVGLVTFGTGPRVLSGLMGFMPRTAAGHGHIQARSCYLTDCDCPGGVFVIGEVTEVPRAFQERALVSYP